MALWTDARGGSSSDRTSIDALFAAEYSRLQASFASVIADTLDRAAYYRVKSSSIFDSTDRPLAICHMAAHMLEEAPSNGQNAKAGGPLQSKSNERGSASYATVPVGVYFGVSAHLLQGTIGGRNLLAMCSAHPSLSGMVL